MKPFIPLTIVIAFFALPMAAYAVDDTDFTCSGSLEDVALQREGRVTGIAKLMNDGMSVLITVDGISATGSGVMFGEVTKIDEKAIRFKIVNNFSLDGRKAGSGVIDRVDGIVSVLFGDLPNAYRLWLDHCTINVKKPKF